MHNWLLDKLKFPEMKIVPPAWNSTRIFFFHCNKANQYTTKAIYNQLLCILLWLPSWWHLYSIFWVNKFYHCRLIQKLSVVACICNPATWRLEFRTTWVRGYVCNTYLCGSSVQSKYCVSMVFEKKFAMYQIW